MHAGQLGLVRCDMNPQPLSSQDGPDEQVTVVKQICKCDTIAHRAMVCLCICRVIVPLQLGYLHNQLWASPICAFPYFFITIGTLPYTAFCLCTAPARMRALVLLCWMTGLIESA